MDSKLIQTLFGTDSERYKNILFILKKNYHSSRISIENKANFEIIHQELIVKFYGEQESENLFLNLVYLMLVGEYIVHRFEAVCMESIKLDIFSSLNTPKVQLFLSWTEDSKDTFYSILDYNLELNFDFFSNSIRGDIFQDLYEDLIQQSNRHKLGEFFTPAWLSSFLIKYLIDNFLGDSFTGLKFLDPSCGTGSFLIPLIKQCLENGKCDANRIFQNIQGHEINPVSGFLAKINYILAISLNLLMEYGKEKRELSIPIFEKDSLIETDKNDFDVIVGNPPWVVMRNIPDPNYREFLKLLTTEYQLMDIRNSHLFTQLELASIFFMRTADTYLKTRGLIFNLLPGSFVLGTHHLQEFQKFQHPMMKLLEILDFENQSEVFNIPSCVLIARKGDKTLYPIPIKKFNQLPRRLTNEKQDIGMRTNSFSPPKLQKLKKSPYYEKFSTGASIFPKALYFVDILDYQNGLLSVKTSDSITSKSNWKGINIQSLIEEQFLFLTLESLDMIPFGIKKLSPVILPIIIRPNNEIKLISISKNSNSRYNWFKFVNDSWIERRTAKSVKRFPSITDRLNYNDLLIKQDLNSKYLVHYAGTGKNICSFVLDRSQIQEHTQYGSGVYINDVKNWVYFTNDLDEAHYLCSVLNSEYLNDLIKPLQPSGLGGPRAVHRKPLEFPIPSFDPNNFNHMELSKLSRNSHLRIIKKLTTTSISRNRAREILRNEIKEIDEIVATMF